MKIIFKTTIMLLLLVSSGVYGQRGIGTNSPDKSAVLELNSNTKGLLLPRLTKAQRDAVVSPVAGLIVYCTDCGSGQMSYHNGSNWSLVSEVSPGAPTIDSAVAGNGEVTVAYTAPADNGGSIITSYTATSNPGNFTGTVSQSGSGTITVTGLENGIGYTFTVTATNAVGTGDASIASNSETPIGQPGAPGNVTATEGNNEQATIAYTAPADNGGSIITSYTATSNPGNFTGTVSQSGSGTITVTGLGRTDSGYTFTVTATNAVGTGAASAASNSILFSPILSSGGGGTYTFLNHNLGADTSLAPHTPVVGLQGGYVQWGKRGSTDFVGAANDGPNGFAAAPTASDANNAAISGWSQTSAIDGSWNVNEYSPAKVTANDPCPTGYRVPTYIEWSSVTSNNTISRTGTFANSNTSYSSALHFGPDANSKRLTLVSSGYRDTSNGELVGRGEQGYYWSSTENSTLARTLYFSSSSVNASVNNVRTYGFSVRCIAE